MKNDTSVDILGVQMYSRDIPSIVDHITEIVLEDTDRLNRCISATGAHGIVAAKKNRSFNELLNHFYTNLPDGMPAVWVGRLKGAGAIKRCYGPDFFAEMMKSSSDVPVRHYLCGGAEGVAEMLKEACNKKFSNTNIVGTYSPPFKEIDEYDYRAIAQKINDSGADMVWIGISTPKQEQFAKRLSAHTNVHFLATVGAAFDFHIGRVKQAPRWMQKAGLEWFFRLSVEPQRLFRRYVEIVPKFMFYSVVDVSKYYLNNNSSEKGRDFKK